MGLNVLELIIVSTNELQLLAEVNNSTCNQKTILHLSLIQGFLSLGTNCRILRGRESGSWAESIMCWQNWILKHMRFSIKK